MNVRVSYGIITPNCLEYFKLNIVSKVKVFNLPKDNISLNNINSTYLLSQVLHVSDKLEKILVTCILRRLKQLISLAQT